MIARAARIALMVVVAWSGVAQAGIEKAGTTAGNFLTVGSGASVLGMGSAGIGLGRDLNATTWNPGALGWLDEIQMGLSHSGLEDEQTQEWAAAGGRFATSPLHWAITGLYHGQGSLEGRDPTGASTGTFNAASTAFGAQLASRFGNLATVGVGVKFASEDLGTTRGSGATFDAGAMLRAGWFGFGVAAQNVGGKMKYDSASYPFPQNFGLGASVDLPEKGLRLAVDANFPDAYYQDVRGGVEWTWKEQFALRAGYRAELAAPSSDPLAGPSFGMGAGINGIWFDYGYQVNGAGTGGEHRLGITLRPGDFKLSAFGQAEPTAPTEPVAKAEPKRDAKAAAAAAKLEAAKVKAAKQEAAKVEAAKLEAAKAKAAKLEAAKAEAAKLEAAKAEAAKLEAAKAEAAKVEAAKAEAAKAEAAKAEAAKAEAAKAEAASSGTQAKPVVAKPAVPAPAPAKVEAPAKSEPAKSEPKKDEEAKPAKSEPIKAANADDEGVDKAETKADETAAKASESSDDQEAKPSKSEKKQAPVKIPSKHKVKSGETLEQIAKMYGTSVPKIMELNNMVNKKIKPGDTLKIPKPED